MNKGNILVVEDDLQVAALITDLLKSRDFFVKTVHTGQAAIDSLVTHPDLILLDRNLPDMDGLDICRRVREDAFLRAVPVVFLSALGSSEERIQGLYVGADDYISKPFHREELVARIEAAMRRNQFRDQLKEEKETLKKELKEIIELKQIMPFFQPIFSLSSFQPIGFEVFGRVSHSGPLSNPEFMFKAALSFGMYFDLEVLCWKKAFEVWNRGEKHGRLFLNCSPYFMDHEQFDLEYMASQGIYLENAVIELTERIAIEETGIQLEKINELKKKNIGIAVDDIGSGYASLNTVVLVRPHFLKIDMNIIQTIDRDVLRQDITKAIVDFSTKHDIDTIAEGIETEAELAMVKKLGVGSGQGYYLGRPQPVVDPRCQAKRPA